MLIKRIERQFSLDISQLFKNTVHVLNFMVYKILWILWYASDPRKFHKTILETILETHIDLTTKIIPMKFNTSTNKPFCQTTKILPTKFNMCMYGKLYITLECVTCHILCVCFSFHHLSVEAYERVISEHFSVSSLLLITN